MSRGIFLRTLLAVVVAVFGLVTLSGDLYAQGNSDEALERAIAAQEKHTGTLLAKEGVEGTGVGLDQNGDFIIKVFTATVGVPGIPQVLENVPVETQVSGKFVAREYTARYSRPVPIGVSTGHPAITAGTIGCRLKDGAGVIYALSNNHVYANSNDASIGDSVLQPGPFDGGQDSDFYRIGWLHDFEPILFDGSGNTIDAAIAEIIWDGSTPRVGTDTIDYGAPSSTTVWDLGVTRGDILGWGVEKSGRTTQLTSGTVDAVNATVDVCYECGGPFCFGCKKLARFVDQIIVTPGTFSAGGDSGSLIVYYDVGAGEYYPVGLLFAGSSSHTIANPIDLVLARFNMTVDGTPQGPVAPAPLSITTTSLPDATVGVAYSATVEATGGTEPYAWSIASGSLPPGLTLDDATGVISGTPTTEGTNNFTVEVTDGSVPAQTDTQQLSITVGSAPEEATTVSVDSITYSTEGGKNSDKHLNITVTLEDDLGNPVAGASVSIELHLDGALDSSGTGTTGGGGTITFSRKNAPSGVYKTTVTDVSATGLTWDGVTPPNSFPK